LELGANSPNYIFLGKCWENDDHEAFGRKCGHECTTEEGGGKEGLLISFCALKKRGKYARRNERE